MVQQSQDSTLLGTSESVNPMIMKHLKGSVAQLGDQVTNVFDSTIKSEKRYVS